MEYKGYMVVPQRGFPMMQIKSKGQGPVPKALEGLYTSRDQAHKAIDKYLVSLMKGKRNGKAKSTRTA